MHILDNPQTYQTLDPSDMISHLRRLPEQCATVWERAKKLELPADYSVIDRAIILGMGGSAIGGELAQGLLAGKTPVMVQRDYALPFPPDEKTLVIASSYSGETEETLSAFAAALDSPAKSLAITTGGKLKGLAEKHNRPVFVIDYRSPPRAALAYSLMPILAILHQTGLAPDLSGDVRQAKNTMVSLARRIGEETLYDRNPAKQLAASLQGKATVIYGAGFLTAVARRWKTQINENAKAWAFFELLPELNHNAVAGLEYPKELLPYLEVVLLSSRLLHPRIRKRLRITGEILARAGLPYEVINAEGKTPLGQMMSLVLFGDYVSYYLALLNNRDSTPVEVIDFLKKSLKSPGRH